MCCFAFGMTMTAAVAQLFLLAIARSCGLWLVAFAGKFVIQTAIASYYMQPILCNFAQIDLEEIGQIGKLQLLRLLLNKN
jgi:hypothetical protein